mmetsp:Transcript_12578/g.22790  ORF Transcript_12578/g.22790 Transcript_12578/m.22790 type:complete len:229 (+) Transcript_12578:453-1139(+)
MKPHAFSLGAHNTTIPQTVKHGLIKGGLKQNGGRSNGIGRVRNNHIKGSLILIHKFGSVHHMNRHARVIVSLGKGREVLFAHVNHITVDFANDNFLHTRMTGNFSQDTAIATSNDQYLLGVFVRIERNMSNHFLIGKFIPLRHLNDPIQDEDISMRLRFKYEHILKVGPMMIQHVFHLERHGLSRPQHTPLMKPPINNQIHSIESLRELLGSCFGFIRGAHLYKVCPG